MTARCNVYDCKVIRHFDTLIVGTLIPSHTSTLTDTAQSVGAGSPLTTEVKLGSNVLVLKLEDVDPLLRTVECSEEGIILSFSDVESKNEAEEHWAPLKEFVVISYHPGCNAFHQRRRHLQAMFPIQFLQQLIHCSVWNTSEIEGTNVILFATPLEWVEAFDTINAEIRPSDLTLDLVHLHRRQKDGSSSGRTPPNGRQHKCVSTWL
ncbi:MAG: hypothetical protein Q9166_002662 [cf. Caloplaca sp. 2 TL-2023]